MHAQGRPSRPSKPRPPMPATDDEIREKYLERAIRELNTFTRELQRLTPSIEALYVPNIDEALDEERAKREFWSAFRVLGQWWADLPPY